MSVLRAPDVLEAHVAELVHEQPRLGVQRLEAGVLHLVVAEHLLHEQQRIGAHEQLALAAAGRPLERRDQPRVLGDVVGGDADRLGEFLDQLAVRPLDADAVAGGPGVSARAAVDVGDERSGRRGGVEWQPRVRGAARRSPRGLP